MMILCLSILALLLGEVSSCDPCYTAAQDTNCRDNRQGPADSVLHFSVHPHLDAFWIFDFESYYQPLPGEMEVQSYFSQNRFSSVRDIFDTAYDVLSRSKELREAGGESSQKAHRSFFNSEMGFFKRWYSEQPEAVKHKVKELLNTKYWQILGGGYVEHDEGCAYYQDIIENYELGLHFLEKQIGYSPKAAISADSFGHSQSTLAILAHLGIEGYFVERSDEHILQQNKTEFIWRAKSANGYSYGALPTHIRWAIHGFEDQFIRSGGKNICDSKSSYIENMRKENQFLKRILKSSHIMRYFGHDFQKFDDYSYSVMEGFMDKFSRESCQKVTALYGNPTEYFRILMSEVFGKVKDVTFREEDIFPIWDYDSGLYWTGYFTTDPYHKKKYRDYGRLLALARKAFLPTLLESINSEAVNKAYDTLEEFAEIVAYLQHHDGISGTSKYTVLDSYEKRADNLANSIQKQILNPMFQTEYPLGSSSPLLTCGVSEQCIIPNIGGSGDLLLKLFNSGTTVKNQIFKVRLPEGTFYEPNSPSFTTICMCYSQPCACQLHLTLPVITYLPLRLKKVAEPKNVYYLKDLAKIGDPMFSHNETHIEIVTSGKEKVSIGYKSLRANPTSRNYAHLSRYGTHTERSFTINSGKYALGNNPKTEETVSTIRRVSLVRTPNICKLLVQWRRSEMKTVITYDPRLNDSWKVETYSNAGGSKLEDLYLELGTNINNAKSFYSDSNGWLTMKRELFHHEDYQAFFSKEKYDDIDGNTYPMTAFSYIKDSKHKLSVNTDRPQGVISPRTGLLWVNYDRISSDDGKWVYETTYRNEYQKFTHFITFSDPSNNRERKLQDMYDHPIIASVNLVQPTDRIEYYNIDIDKWEQWADIAGTQNTKFWIRPWNDSSVTLRIQNNQDQASQKVTLFADKESPYLTAYFGRNIRFAQIQEMSLGGNKKYEQFLKDKWNWNTVVNLTKENQIFEKEFGEVITLRPLEIRTFKFTGLKFGPCSSPNELSYKNKKVLYSLDTSKPMPTRTQSETKNEEEIRDFLHNGDHCNGESPILHEKQTEGLEKAVKDPPQPTGKTIRQEHNQPSLKEQYPQRLPEHVSPNQNIYHKLEDILEQPINIKQTKKPTQTQTTAKPVDTHQVPNEQKNKNPEKPSEQQEKPLEDQNVKWDNSWDEQLLSLKKKVMVWSPLTKNQKEKYFGNKLKQIEQALKQLND